MANLCNRCWRQSCQCESRAPDPAPPESPESAEPPAPEPAGIPPVQYPIHDDDDDPKLVCDAGNYCLFRVNGESLTPAENKELAAEIVRCVNAFHPARDAVQPPQTVLALAILKGDESAAYAAADDVLAHQRQPDGFVARGELVAMLREWVDAIGNYDLAWYQGGTDYQRFTCKFCSATLTLGEDTLAAHKPDCVVSRLTALLARLDAGTPAAPAGESR